MNLFLSISYFKVWIIQISICPLQADPSCRYTAWSSMGTLIKKGLVIKESSPARYSLTEAGCELAHRLEAIQADDFPARPPPVQRGPAIVPNTVSQDRG